MKNFKSSFLLTIVTVFAVSIASAQQETYATNDTAANGTVKFRRYNLSVNPQPVANEKSFCNQCLALPQMTVLL